MFRAKQRKKKKHTELRQAYFIEKGYDFIVPEDTEARADLIRKLMDSLDPDYDSMIMLFDPEMDRENADMLNLMGIIYNDTNFHNFNPEQATTLHLKAASVGSAASAYNIGMAWYHGINGPINYEQAMIWFQKAHDLGHGCAISVLAPILRYISIDKIETEKKIKEMCEVALERAGPWAWYEKAIQHIRDPQDENYNPTEALRILDIFTKEGMCGRPKSYASKVLALRYYLGFFVEQDLLKAEYYFDKIPLTERDPQVRYRISNLAEKVRNMMHYKDSFVEYEEAFAIARTAYESGRFPNRMPSTEAMSNVLWAVCQLAANENWSNHYEWESFWQSVQMDLIGIDQSDLERATYDFGPFYNKIDQDKMPILGAYEQPGTYLSPIGGLASITSVVGNRLGEIKINGIPANDNMLTFITDEDIDVALILAFADKSGPIWPSLSIEPFEKMTKENLRWTFKRKVFEPEWVGHTDLGKTLYSTDYWLRNLAWTPWQFNRHECSDLTDEQNRYIKALTSELKNIGGRDDGLWSRVMLKPGLKGLEWKNNILGGITCKAHGFTIMIDGADVIMQKDDSEDRKKNLNDGRFHTGRVAASITDNYNNIAQLFPIYERNRQLMILIHSVNGMRERDFKLNHIFREKVDQGYAHYRSLPKPQLRDLVVK